MTDAQINIAKIVKFVKRHSEHAEVDVALDVVPNVIRFDCQDFNCAENLQIPYNPEHL